MIIQQHKSLCELYGELLVRQRQIVKADSDGETLCRRCKKRKKDHGPQDMRCTIWQGSQFLSDDTEEMAKVFRAIELIEELQSL